MKIKSNVDILAAMVAVLSIFAPLGRRPRPPQATRAFVAVEPSRPPKTNEGIETAFTVSDTTIASKSKHL